MHTDVNDPIQGILICRAGRLHCVSTTRVYVKKPAVRVTDRLQGIVFANSASRLRAPRWQDTHHDNEHETEQRISHSELRETIRAATDDLTIDELDVIASSSLFGPIHDPEILKKKSKLLKSLQIVTERIAASATNE